MITQRCDITLFLKITGSRHFPNIQIYKHTLLKEGVAPTDSGGLGRYGAPRLNKEVAPWVENFFSAL